MFDILYFPIEYKQLGDVWIIQGEGGGDRHCDRCGAKEGGTLVYSCRCTVMRDTWISKPCTQFVNTKVNTLLKWNSWSPL